MTRVLDLHELWLKDTDYARDYAALEEEFSLAEALIAARLQAGITQAELAERMHTRQSTIARLESGRALPSTRTLRRIAEATGTHLRISFEGRISPAKSNRRVKSSSAS